MLDIHVTRTRYKKNVFETINNLGLSSTIMDATQESSWWRACYVAYTGSSRVTAVQLYPEIAKFQVPQNSAYTNALPLFPPVLAVSEVEVLLMP